MIEKCKKCGNITEGDLYTFYHGLKTRDTSERAGITGKVRIITKQYSFIKSTSYFLCNGCVKKEIMQKRLIGLIGGVVTAILGILAYATAIPSLLGKPGGLVQAWAWCCFPISFFFIIMALTSLNKKETAENMAIGFGKKEIKLSDTFWTSNQYKRLNKGS